MISLSKNIIYRHLFIWLFLIAFIVYSDAVNGSIKAKFIYFFLFTFNFAISYYLLLLLIFPTFLFKKNKLVVLFYFLILVFFICWDFFHLKYILPSFNGNTPRGKLSLFEFIKSSALFFSFVTVSAFGSYLNWESIERYKLALEKEKRIISSELSFLKNQFNSHLTFNFLNFCYAKLFKASPKAAESVEYFSEMLHYSLNFNSNQKLLLVKEIDYIQNFINIQKCLTTEIYADFSVNLDQENYYIMPMILTVFVENAFKHGVINDYNNPIEIKLEVKDYLISFVTHNKKKNQKIIISSGVGIENIKQTLNLFYENKHSLQISETDTDYYSKLELNIK
jgi:two-component system LytT family sensor kinase